MTYLRHILWYKEDSVYQYTILVGFSFISVGWQTEAEGLPQALPGYWPHGDLAWLWRHQLCGGVSAEHNKEEHEAITEKGWEPESAREE